jgi:hypothetical protein
MTDYALSTFESRQLLSAGAQPAKMSLGHRLLLWIETSQQRKADREIARVFASFGTKPDRRP